MLFRALIDRLLGSSTTQNWKETDRLKITRLSYKKYPNLLDIIVQLLTPKRQGGATELTNTALEGVFPAFQILQRAKPPAERRAEIQQLVFALTASSHWHVRDMAARTLAALLGPEERVEWVLALLEMPFQRQNALHGVLSSVKYLVKEMCEADDNGLHGKCLLLFWSDPRADDDVDDLDLLAFALFEQFERLYEKNICPLTKSAYLDIATMIQRHHIVKGHWKCKSPRHILSFQVFLTAPASSPLICEAFGDGEDLFHHLAKGALHMFNRFQRDQKLGNSGKSAGDALLRRALSLATVQHLLLLTCAAGEQPSLQVLATDLFKHITDQDSDTCRTTLESLMTTISAPVLHAGAAVQTCIADILSTAATSTDLEVAATVRHAFASLLDRGLDLPAARLAPIMLGSERQQIAGLGSPSLHEGALPLLGRYIDARVSASRISNGAAASAQEEEKEQLLTLFTRTLRADLEETQPFPTRWAAIAALDTIRGFWQRQHQGDNGEQHHLALALIAYDALNDDDDEIRDAAARIATRIIVGGPAYNDSIPTVLPLTAARKLAAYLRQTYADSPLLCAEALHRLLDHESGRDAAGARGALEWSEAEGGFAAQLREARMENAALFAREKQNLFLDPVREVGVWGEVLGGLSLCGGDGGDGAVSARVVRALEEWCVAGLRELRLLAERERDGAMGWFGRGEVFLLGWRVVGAVRVVLGWKRRGVVVERRGALERKKRVGRYRASEIRKALRETADAWVEAELHGLWLGEVEDVLSESVVAKLVDVSGVLVEVVWKECVV